MKTNSDSITRIMFLIMVLLLFIPLLQQKFQYFDVKPLNGAIEMSKQAEMTLDKWFDETFQQGTEEYLNQHFGFRNWLVRLHNQIKFTVFSEANAKGVVVGKEDFLFEENYIKAYYGRDFIGDSIISSRIERLKVINNALSSLGKTFVVCFAPGKAQFYPEYIPDYLKSEFGKTNYQSWTNGLAEAGIPIIDFNAWFLKMKGQTQYPIYPKTGIHWSHFGIDLVLDSLFRFIEIKQGIDIPDVKLTGYQLSQNYLTPDCDIEEGMNLLFPIENEPLAYSGFTVNETGKTKPKAMIISDSFFWPVYNRGICASVFNNGEFWYYNTEVFSPASEKSVWAPSVDLFTTLLNKDIVILLVTDANLPDFPWEFDTHAFKYLSGNPEKLIEERDVRIRGYIEVIMGNADWLKNVTEKARDKNIPLEDQLRLDAIYMIENEEK